MPSDHVSPIYVAEVNAGTFVSETGESGILKIYPPVPAGDFGEVP